MTYRITIAALAAGCAAVTVAVCPTAAAVDPEFPRNGVIPPGVYAMTQHPANVVGTSWEGCDLEVDPDGVHVRATCPNGTRQGKQRAVDPDETYILFDGSPCGLDLVDIDPRQGLWIGVPNLAGTGLRAPYELAGVSLTRR